MTFTCHSLGLSDRIKSDFLIPSGEAVTKSVMDVAVELFDTLAMIVSLQDVSKGTPKQEPSNGVAPTNSG